MPTSTETAITPTSAEIEAAQRRAARTRVILDRERGHAQEFTRLHAIMCAGHGWEAEDYVALDRLIDTTAIAERLDEMMAEIRSEIRQEAVAQAAPDDGEPDAPDDGGDGEPDAPDDGGGRWERRQLGIGS